MKDIQHIRPSIADLDVLGNAENGTLFSLGQDVNGKPVTLATVVLTENATFETRSFRRADNANGLCIAFFPDTASLKFPHVTFKELSDAKMLDLP